MNRRTLLKGMAATAAGLILPPTLAEHVEAATSGSRCSWCGVKVSPLMSSSWVVREPGSPAVLGCDACIYRDSQSRTRYWSLDQTMSGSWLSIPRDSCPMFRHNSERWRVDVHYPDGGIERHAAPTPERMLKLRIARKDTISGAAVWDADTATLLVVYGRTPFERFVP